MDEPRSNDLSRRALLRSAAAAGALLSNAAAAGALLGNAAAAGALLGNTAAAGALLAAPANATPSDASRSSSARRPSKAAVGTSKRPRITVIGAGVFGTFTALALRQRGAEVTLIDAWGAGHSRSSSGDETRVIRGVYADRVYVELAARAFELWPEFEKRVGRTIYRRTGALWMVSDSGDFVRQAAANLKAVGFAYEEITTEEAAKRFPQVAFDGVHWALWEPHAGFLLARQACGLAAEELVKQGGEFRIARVLPFEPSSAGSIHEIQLANGPAQHADAFVFACGPWLGQMLPSAVGSHIQATRQEVFYFGTPAGETRFDPDTMPVWVDVGERLYYGIPGNERRGFKIADDTRGETIDPTTQERIPTPEALSRARAFIAHRFPALAGAPLVESRVCQYENSPDHQFILDRHPRADNVWIIGGGSGHGFKFGPAWGERVAQTVLGERPLDPFFGLARLEKKASNAPVTPRDLRGERKA